MKYVYFVRGQQHLNLCKVSAASVLKADPDAQISVYSDDNVVISYVPDHITAEHVPEGTPIMLANLEAQCRAICDTPKGELVAFLDTDILLLKPPEFESGFDVAATWRDRVASDDDGNALEGIAKSMPYNYGVLFARGGFAATEAFIWMRERIRRMSTQLQDWYGNQVALAALCGARPPSGTMSDYRRLAWTPTTRGNGVWVTKLPCTEWNYTPGKAGEDLTGRHALHFKGGSRKLMQGYAEAMGIEWPDFGDKAAA